MLRAIYCSPETLLTMSEAIDAMFLDEDYRFLAASSLCGKAFRCDDTRAWHGRTIMEVIQEHDDTYYPDSEFRGNGVVGFRDALAVAKEIGAYTSTLWMVDEDGYCLRLHFFVKKASMGYCCLLTPMSDALSHFFEHYDRERHVFVDGLRNNAEVDWLDLSIFDGLMAGLSYKALANNLNTSVGQIRYRISRWEKASGATIPDMVERFWEQHSADALVSKPAMIHGRSRLYL